MLKNKLNLDSFFTDPLVSAFYEGVDTADYIEALAKAVEYAPFEWEETSITEEEKHTSNNDSPLDEREIAFIVKEIISDVDYPIYHQCLEFAYELRDILKEIREAITPYGYSYTDNPYHAMKLNKRLYKDVSAIVREKFHNKSWTLLD